jgi:hypothetical protein
MDATAANGGRNDEHAEMVFDWVWIFYRSKCKFAIQSIEGTRPILSFSVICWAATIVATSCLPQTRKPPNSLYPQFQAST